MGTDKYIKWLLSENDFSQSLRVSGVYVLLFILFKEYGFWICLAFGTVFFTFWRLFRMIKAVRAQMEEVLKLAIQIRGIQFKAPDLGSDAHEGSEYEN